MSQLSKPYSPEVAAFHAELAAMARWVVSDGGSADELLDAIEKPWRWAAEAGAALALEEATREWAEQ